MTPGQAPALEQALEQNEPDEAQGHWVQLSSGMSVFIEEPQGHWVQLSNSTRVFVDEAMLQEGAVAQKIGKQVSTDVQEVLIDIFARDVYREWGEKGMLIERLSLNAHKHRIIEPDDKDTRQAAAWIVSVLNEVDVTPKDVVLIQIPDGFLMEIPCMQRKIIFRKGLLAISSPTEMRSCSIRAQDSEDGEINWRFLMEEALLYDFGNMSIVGKNVLRENVHLENREKLRACIIEKYPTSSTFFAMRKQEKHSDEMVMILKLAAHAYGIIGDPPENIEAFRELGREVYWRNDEISRDTVAESEQRGQEQIQYQEQLIQAVQSAFSVQDLCYMELEDALKAHIKMHDGRKKLTKIAEELGIKNAAKDELRWLTFVAKIYGYDNPVVQRVERSLTMSA